MQGFGSVRVRFSSLDQAPTFDMHIKFYYAAGTNCCERVRWALDYKRVPYEMVDLDQPHPGRSKTRGRPALQNNPRVPEHF